MKRYEVRLSQDGQCVTVFSCDSIRVSANQFEIWCDHIHRSENVELWMVDTSNEEILESKQVRVQ